MKLKLNFNFILGLGALALAGCAGAAGGARSDVAVGAAAAPGTATDGSAAQRLVSLIDYVGGDYRLAVRDGQVLAEAEYQEQQRFAAEIRERGQALVGTTAKPDPLLEKLASIESLVAARADPAAVAAACREAHDLAVARFNLETRPLRRPSLARAESLYAESCAACHGVDGDADTERARGLDPRPASFRNPERLRDLSPYRVYNALSFGVAGTAMASFETLSPQERWDLAFYVFRLGHADEPSAGPLELALADLATRSDRELLAAVGGPGEPSAAARLAFARLEAPYVEPPAGADVARTREMLREAMARLADSGPREADGLVLDAYLLGFEPAEPRLVARDAARTRAVEAGFRDLRSALARADTARARAEARRLDETLAGLAGRQKPLLPFVAAALIYLREGLEAALLVGALLAGTARLGRPRATRFVHAGWLLALPAGLLTWWLLTRLLTLAARQRELMEAGVSLLAAAVLFSVSFWMISKAESRRWSAYLKERMEGGLPRRGLLVLTGLAFLAAYREAAETVLFTQALLLEADGHAVEVWAGALAGLLAVAAFAFLMKRTVLRLPVAPFFAVSSLLLLALAVSFAGSGIYALVAAGYLEPRPVAVPEVPWLGIHADLTGLGVQLSIVMVVALAGLATLRRWSLAARRIDEPDPRP